MKIAAVLRRSEAALLTVLVAAAVILTTAMAWRAIRAERRQRQTAARAISNYSTLIGEELARRTAFEFEQFGFLRIRGEIAAALREGNMLLSAEDLRNLSRKDFDLAAAAVERTFFANFQRGTVVPPQPPEMERWILTHMQRLVLERRQLPITFHVLRLPGARDRWIVYIMRPDNPQHVAGFLVRNEALTQMAARALSRRSPFPATLGNRFTQKDLFLRIVRPGGEIFRTPGTFQPAYGRRMVLPENMGAILGGATLECSFSARVVPILVAGGIPARNEATPIVMLVATFCILGAVVLVQRRARELDRLRADFVAGVSHELRTPLTQIRMFADTLLLSRVRSEADKQRSLQNIARETARLSNLVENLLSFSRGERGTLKIVRTDHDVCTLVRDAVASFTELAAPYRATLVVAAGERCIAAVDEDALKQVVLNLLDNALRYGRRGQTIEIAVVPLDRHVRITVEDEGPGIPAAERERIWMKFYRLERDRETNHSGSGIGLAVVREIVERHGGHCFVEDGSRGGARFVIDIPWETTT